jgi:glycosyltransferase involved in cell wall biosynthesis
MRDHFEIVLVDNGSTDGTADVAAEYPGTVLLREATPGAYAARNTGLRRARGGIVAFTDADCIPDRGWLRAVRDGMADPATAILVGECRYPPEASIPLHLLGSYENAKAEYVLTRCSRSRHFAYANNMAVRAALFRELGLFREWKRAADTELVHRVAEQRPELATVFCPSMRVTHLEFLRVRDRLRRLSLYTHTNAQIPSFRELRLVDRAGILVHLGRRAFNGGVARVAVRPGGLQPGTATLRRTAGASKPASRNGPPT